MGCHFLLQGIFLTQGSNLGSPALQADSSPTELQGEGPTVTGVAKRGTRLKWLSTHEEADSGWLDTSVSAVLWTKLVRQEGKHGQVHAVLLPLFNVL